MTSSPAPDRGSREDTTILVLFLAAVVWNLVAASVGWSHAISDWYGWRQTQTAIAAYFMQQGGPWIDYQVPILGPPWQLPHEFPLYQALVVTLAAVSGLPLEAAGRTVSLALFYSALGAGHLLLGELGVSGRRRLLVLAFWLVSPMYVFWSRTFMIESTALCLCLLFLLFTGRFVTRGRPADALIAVVAGCLGAAVKPPTVVAFAGLAGVWWLHAQRWPRAPLGAAVRAMGVVVIVLAPGAGWAWQRHADALKARNPFASGISSGQLLHDWVVAPADLLRFQPGVLSPVWERAIPYAVGHPVVLAAAVLGVVVAGRRRGLFTLSLVGFLIHFAVFAPLDTAFDYYWYGAGLFLVAAVGLAAVALLECDDARRHLAWLLVLLVAAGGVHGYATTMLPLQRLDAYRKPDWLIRLARAVSDATRQEDVIVAIGLDWNPELPYYARRRALMWPGWSDPRSGSDDLSRALASLDGQAVGALVCCRGSAPPETIARLRARWGLVPSPTFRERCALYVRPPSPPLSGAPGS
jgi:hypothetical protein